MLIYAFFLEIAILPPPDVFGPQPVNTSNTLVWPPKQTRKFFAVKPKRVENDGKYLGFSFFLIFFL